MFMVTYKFIYIFIHLFINKLLWYKLNIINYILNINIINII